MEFGPGTYALSLAAGGLSTLSPCVLPLVPILIGSAVAAHRMGPLALAGGLMLSFAVVGTFIAFAGASLGLDTTVFRTAAAVLLAAFGIVLLSTALQERFAVAASGLSSAGSGLLDRVTLNGAGGQFVLGLLLGVVWSPCVGPTLGAAITLAAQGESLPQVATVMGLFGLGAGLPLAALGLVSREAMLRTKGRLLNAGKHGKRILGAVMLLLGVMILSGLDKTLEAWALEVLPEGLTRLTISI